MKANLDQSFRDLARRARPLHDLLFTSINREGSISEQSEVDSSEIQSKWLAAVAPGEPHKLIRRLNWDNIQVCDLDKIINHNSNHEFEQDVENPLTRSWIDGLKEIQSALQDQWDIPLIPSNIKTEEADEKQLPFVDLWYPVKISATGRLENIFRKEREFISLGTEVFERLGEQLLQRLTIVAEQLLMHEFNKVRGPGTVLAAHLGQHGDGFGPPLRDKYMEFICKHRRDGLNRLILEYPVFARLIGEVYDLWIESSIELLQRIVSDREFIDNIFSIPRGAKLSSIKQGISDAHHGGRSAAILMFEWEDSSCNILYKPKDMRLDRHYQKILGDLNSYYSEAPLKPLRVGCRDGYGYMEYVEHRPCKDVKSLQLFYKNAGRLLATLHALGCTDCHHENLIADGEQLFLIDAETLYEPNYRDHSYYAGDPEKEVHVSVTDRKIQESVLRTGLLPYWIFNGPLKIAVDISALGISPPKSNRSKRQGWFGINTDGMVPSMIEINSKLPTSLPIGFGEENPIKHYIKFLADGFKEQCDALIARRASWHSESSLFNEIENIPHRFVFRPTRVYYAIQASLFKPDALRSSFKQALKLELLARIFLLTEIKPKHWPIFAAEILQMQQLDIPIFTHPTGGNDLPLTKPLNSVNEFFESNGLESSRLRIEKLNSEEVRFQLQLIRGSLEAKMSSTRTNKTVGKKVNEKVAINQINPPTGLEASLKVTNHLINSSIFDQEGDVEWLGIELGDDGYKMSFGPVGMSLYGGKIGIACLLARLRNLDLNGQEPDDITNKDQIIDSILKPLIDMSKDDDETWRFRWWRDEPLGLNGCGGVLLALKVLDLDLKDETLINLETISKKLVFSIKKEFLDSDTQLDIIGGVAGLIGPLLNIDSSKALELAVNCGERLLSKQRDDGGWVKGDSNKALLGFSHGTAGYAASLARLSVVSGEIRFLEAAHRALTHERAKFSPAHHNWPCFLDQHRDVVNDELVFMNSWCHGAPGIAISRACLWGTELWDKQAAEEMAIALFTTTQIKYDHGDHLCCGSLGLVSIMRVLRDGPWKLPQEVIIACDNAVERIRYDVLTRCADDNINLKCFGTEDGNLLLPGFFTGLSGMAFALLEDTQSKDVLQLFLTCGLMDVKVDCKS